MNQSGYPDYISSKMPTYDYECRNCSHRFEFFQNMSDNALTKCPDCSSNSLRRLISVGSGIIFKGSGFYVNDSRDGKTRNKKADAPVKKTEKPDSSGASAGSTPEKTGKSESSRTIAST